MPKRTAAINLFFMKKSFIVILIVFVFTSCTKVLYTHNDYMQRFRTKQDVINSFGLPTEKREEGDILEWVYYFGKTTTGIGYSNTNQRSTISSDYSSVYGNSNGLSVARVNESNRYVKFTFDKNNNVISYNSSGVDYTQRVKDKKATTWCIVLSIVASVGMMAAVGSGNGAF